MSYSFDLAGIWILKMSGRDDIAEKFCYNSMEKMFEYLDKHIRVSMLTFYAITDNNLGVKTLDMIKASDLKFAYKDFYSKVSGVEQDISELDIVKSEEKLARHELDVLIISDALRENKTDDPSLYAEYYKGRIWSFLTSSTENNLDLTNVEQQSESDIVLQIYGCAMLDFLLGKYERASELFVLYSQLGDNSLLKLEANFYELSSRIISQNASGITAIIDIIRSKVDKFSKTYFSDNVLSVDTFLNSEDFDPLHIHLWGRFLHLALLGSSIVDAGYNIVINQFYTDKTGWFFVSNFFPHLLKYLAVAMIMSSPISFKNIFGLAKSLHELIDTQKTNGELGTASLLNKYSLPIAVDNNWYDDPIIKFFVDSFYSLKLIPSNDFFVSFSVIAKDYVFCNWNLEFLESSIVLLIRMRVQLFGEVELTYYKDFIFSLSEVLIKSGIMTDKDSSVALLNDIYSRICDRIQDDFGIRYDKEMDMLSKNNNEIEQIIYNMNFKIDRIRNSAKAFVSNTMHSISD